MIKINIHIFISILPHDILYSTSSSPFQQFIYLIYCYLGDLYTNTYLYTKLQNFLKKILDSDTCQRDIDITLYELLDKEQQSDIWTKQSNVENKICNNSKISIIPP